ncbi:acetyltransferase [Halobacillus shinanisalinarum]|uniref:Lysine N-acyltransferase MbtK n=1 Tax=Halobacillus shinanisalinarum TaxID=2932258 RepID=A0ABY4H3Z9_9BACI|nr:GNAT family N-acetyltransferase [Halobacillus shinanisalinarum]UOQ94307.1 acetyltransferase [Halobacillus shinanisalinarum]
MEHKVFDHTVKQSISFRPFDLNRDFPSVFKWMHESHVIPYWQLNFPKEELFQHMKKAVHDQDQCLYIGLLNGQPMSYWEAYWVKGDVVEGSYPAEPFDQGIHLLIGEKDYLGKGLALPLLRAMVNVQFRHKATQRVIAEPDYRNKKMIHVFEKCGFKQMKPIQLPDKKAMLMFCERDVYEKRWPHVYS